MHLKFSLLENGSSSMKYITGIFGSPLHLFSYLEYRGVSLLAVLMYMDSLTLKHVSSLHPLLIIAGHQLNTLYTLYHASTQ